MVIVGRTFEIPDPARRQVNDARREQGGRLAGKWPSHPTDLRLPAVGVVVNVTNRQRTIVSANERNVRTIARVAELLDIDLGIVVADHMTRGDIGLRRHWPDPQAASGQIAIRAGIYGAPGDIGQAPAIRRERELADGALVGFDPPPLS